MITTSTPAETGGLRQQDIVTALAPKEGRGPVLNKDLKVWQKNMDKHLEEKGGEAVFKANIAENESDLLVNFDQMRRVLDDESKRIQAMPSTTDAEKSRQAEAQKHQNRLVLRCNVYDKLLNGKGSADLSAEEVQDTMTIMGKLPGFCESVVIALDGKISLEKTKQLMAGTGFVSLSAEQRKVIGTMIDDTVNDEAFHNMLSKSLSKLELDVNDATLSQTIISLKESVKDEAKRKQEVADADIAMASYNSQSQDVRTRIDNHGEKVEAALAKLEEKFRPIDLTQSGFKSKADNLKLKRDNAKDDYDIFAKTVKPDPATLERLHQAYEGFMYQYDAAFDLEGLFAQANGESDYKEYKRVSEATDKKDKAEEALKTIQNTKEQIAAKESERSKYADVYKRKMEVALSESMKRNWNENLLKKAQTAAEARRAAADEAKAKDESEQAKREELAGKIVEKFIYPSYLKYRGGKTVGWNDRDLKNFVKKDMFSHSPAQLAREMFRRINSSRSDMPSSYSKELKAMYEEMGLGKGEPPMSMADVMNKIKPEKWEEISQKVVPDVLGYAYHRGYYFDRLRINPAQAEFMRQMYGDEFFTKAIEKKGKYAELASKMVDDGVLTGGAENQAKIKEMLGKDWVQGSKRLMKTLAVAGAIGAGTYAGLSFIGGSAGAWGGVQTLRGIGEAAVHTVRAASAGTTEALRKVSGAVTTGTTGFEFAHQAKDTAPIILDSP